MDQPWLLKKRRAHEVYGPAAMAFALIAAARKTGPVLFVDASHGEDRLYPSGASRFLDVSRLLIARSASHMETLWTAEEALRSSCVPVVIARLGGGLDLTAGRRLQLAAEAGNATGIFILPKGMGSNAAETRWHCTPVRSPSEQLDSTLFEWNCIKNKTGTNGNWIVHWNGAAHHIDILSQDSNRPLFAAEAR